MTISFNGIPTSNRVPFTYVEFDSSKAQQGPALLKYKGLIVGQKMSAGTATADIPVLVTSAAQAKTLFGNGSMLHRQCTAWFKNNKATEVWCGPLADAGGGTAATGTVTMVGTATAAGTLAFYIGGVLVQVAVASGDTPGAIATALVAAIAALTTPVALTAAVDGMVPEQVNFTAKNKGTLGNTIDLRFNYNTGDIYPTAVSGTIVAMASGAGNPVLTTLISNMGETQYHVIAFPYTDATNLNAMQTEMTDRWGPNRAIDGVLIAHLMDTVGNLGTFGVAKNDPRTVVTGLYKCPTPSDEISAAVAAVAAYFGNIDPARPFQTLPLAGVLPPAQTDIFSQSEKNTLLFDGIATLTPDTSGVVRIERLITTYQRNGAGLNDTAYLDLTTVLTLSYLRFDFRATMSSKYPRHKLASDGTKYGPGQAIITPKVGRAEAIAKFRQWEELGLVEGADQFKRDLVVERNVTDVNRLDFLLPTDLVNQLTVTGVQIGFLL